MSKSQAPRPIRNASRYLFGGTVASFLCFVAAIAVAADAPKANDAIPRLMQEPGVAWRAYLFGGPRAHPPSPADI